MKIYDLIETDIQWKPIQDWPMYEVSTSGQVRSVKTKKVMAPWESRRRGGVTDLRVTLSSGGKKKGLRIHRLMAKAFLPNPENLPEVDHIDGNPHNNNLSNLEWVTTKENAARRMRALSKNV